MMSFTTRPEIRGTFGVAASTHWIASQVAMGVLERGGNAFDAAVSAGFALQVLEPHLNGPGGEVPILFWSAKEGRVRSLCGQGSAPALADAATFRRMGLDLVPGIAMMPAAILTGLAFSAPIMAFSATQRSDNGFSALFRFVITPLFLFSGVFFPITQLPPLIQPIAYLTPLWHGVSLARGIALGTIDAPLALLNVTVLCGFIVVGALLAGIAFSRKLVK